MRNARSRSAEPATMVALLPPSSRVDRPNRAATRCPTTRPMVVEPVAETTGTRAPSTRAAPPSRPPVTTTDHAVAANQPKRRVPRPQRDREVEGGDHAHHARRVPLLHQPVVRPFAPQGQTIKLPRQANGQVADVDRTSPRPSETTLPASIDTGRPSTSLFRRNSSRATAPARRAAVRAPSATCRTPCATGWSSP